MTDLGHILELLHGAGASYQRLHAVIQTWQDFSLSAQAFDRAAKASGGQVFGAHFVGDEDPDEGATEGTRRVWIERPDKLREESRHENVESLAIKDGSRSYQYTPEAGAMVADSSGQGGVSLANDDSPVLFEPASVIGLLDFERVGEGKRAGRPTLTVRAVPKKPKAISDDWALMGIGEGADVWMLDIDVERGVLLRSEARLDGKPFDINEVTEISFDELIPAATFEFRPPAGVTVRNLNEEMPMGESPLHEVISRVPFKLFVPEGSSAERRVTFFEGGGPGQPTLVMLKYFTVDAALQITVVQCAAGSSSEPDLPDLPKSRETERNGITMCVREQTEDWPQNEIRFDREGTAITVQSNEADLDQLFELAGKLVPFKGN